MIDAVYVAGTIAFFVLMLLYVAGCERLGRGTEAGEQAEDMRS